MPSAEQAAAALAAKILAQGDEAGKDAPSSDDDPAADDPQDAATTLDFPSFDVELPADLQAGLDEPEDEPELDDDDDDEDDEDDDDFEGNTKLKKKLAKAERVAAHYRALRARDSRGKWEEEAKKFFPLSETVLPSIAADSRRAFLKQARIAHETVKPFVEKYLADAKVAADAAIEVAKTDARAAAEKQWGTGGNDPAPVEETTKRELRPVRRHDLTESIKKMLIPPK